MDVSSASPALVRKLTRGKSQDTPKLKGDILKEFDKLNRKLEEQGRKHTRLLKSLKEAIHLKKSKDPGVDSGGEEATIMRYNLNDDHPNMVDPDLVSSYTTSSTASFITSSAASSTSIGRLILSLYLLI